MDFVDRETRSRMMASVRSRDTKPELMVRRTAHALGYRFRLHRGDLPGRPNLVFPQFRIALFVHGCFWHSHEGCRRATVPGSNRIFWGEKLAGNRERDRRCQKALEASGWKVVILWECGLRTPDAVELILRKVLPQKGGQASAWPPKRL